VAEILSQAEVEPDDPEYKKWEAASQANLQAAILCNHTKKAPPSWPKRLERFETRREKGQQRVVKYQGQVQEYGQKLQELEAEAEERVAARKTEAQKEKTRAAYEKKVARAIKRVETAQERLERAQIALGKIEAQMAVASDNRAWNLGTSLKSYIDPRVYYRWGQEVDYDVLERFYPKKLRRKFAWVKDEDQEENGYL
jgi:DNA topoisomerase-1